MFFDKKKGLCYVIIVMLPGRLKGCNVRSFEKNA